MVWATELSPEALTVARQNLTDLTEVDPVAAARVQVAPGDWFAALPTRLAGHVDLMVANPPYVAEAEYPGLDPMVREWEPRMALVAGPGTGGVGGMADVEAVVAGAPPWLRPWGVLVVEIAPDQSEAAADAARQAGFAEVGLADDLAGRVRMLVARR